MQRMMGVDEPDYGHLLDDMELRSDEPVPVARYCARRVEVEIGFVLGVDLPGEGCTPADVLAATERVVPALELIDSRIADWRITIGDTIADNASSAGFVVTARAAHPATSTPRPSRPGSTRTARPSPKAAATPSSATPPSPSPGSPGPSPASASRSGRGT
ncbi:2-keto-4-pentenoate hydratase [Streptomyces sp. NPDC048370]|uniref:2-keto-4-pentenoate hydratase n=1 Tax=Streptomyces sp. NPDC048370 TaxID=3365540 RepID=UPI003721284C